MKDQPTVPLKEYFEKIFEEKEKALQAALTAVKEENRKTEVAAEKRFELLNELRGDVATKAEVQAVEKILDDLKTRLNLMDGRNKGLSQGWALLIGGIGFISAIVGLFITFSK